MNEAFAMIHKNANLTNTMSASNFGREKGEQIELVSKVTDQNVRNVYNALETHKNMVEERFSELQIENERLRGFISQLDTDIAINGVVGNVN